MMFDQGGPCELQSGLLDIARLVIQSATAVMVGWLAKRAVSKDSAERKANGHKTNGN